MARRAASISRAVMRARLVALRPYSPNETELPRWGRPVFVPLNILRYFVRLGCCMLSTSRGRRRARGGSVRGGGLRGLGGRRLGVHLGDLALLEDLALEDPDL